MVRGARGGNISRSVTRCICFFYLFENKIDLPVGLRNCRLKWVTVELFDHMACSTLHLGVMISSKNPVRR